MELTKPEHEVTCTDNPEHLFVCTCGNPGKHEWRIKQGWADRCPDCDLTNFYKRVTNPDPLCPKCGQHRAFCKHSGFDIREHVKTMPVVR